MRQGRDIISEEVKTEMARRTDWGRLMRIEDMGDKFSAKDVGREEAWSTNFDLLSPSRNSGIHL
jgi:hypothetical protein